MSARKGKLIALKVQPQVGAQEWLADDRQQQALANEVADQLAGEAARMYAVPELAM